MFDRLFIKQPRIRALVTRCLYGDKDAEVSLMGCRLIINSTAENGYLRAFKKAQGSSLWRDEVSTLCALFSILRPGDLFVDVGANIGLFSCMVSRLPDVEVVAIEANKDTFCRLEKNCAAHGVRAIHAAISDRDQILQFCSGAVSHVFAAKAHRNEYHFGGLVEMQAHTLDKLIHSDRPMILKLDVEGHELEVLKGASALIANARIHAVVLDASAEARKAATWLESQGFIVCDATSLSPVTDTSGVFIALSPSRRSILSRKNAG